MIRRISALALSLVIAFVFCACSFFESDDVDSSKPVSSQQYIEYISVKDYASKGEIYNCEFALKTSPDDIKAKYHYGEEIEDSSEEGVHDHDSDEAYAGDQRSDNDEGGTATESALAFVGKRTEQREHEYRQDIIQRHDRTGCGLRQTEVVSQNKRYDSVVRLPECADKEERKSDENCSLIIKLHKFLPFFFLLLE